VNWHRLRREGFLTLSIVLASSVLLDMVVPNLDLRQTVILIAVIALLLGWVP